MDVFISYSSEDKNVADAVCHVLEENGITCWVAPRDVQPGISYARQIIHAIKECQVFVLILSKQSNVSEHVGNEVDCAFKAQKPIIPFAIDETEINEELDYYLSRRHWLVAYPNYRERTKDLVVSIKKLLGSDSTHVVQSQPVRVEEERTAPKQEKSVQGTTAEEKKPTPEPSHDIASSPHTGIKKYFINLWLPIKDGFVKRNVVTSIVLLLQSIFSLYCLLFFSFYPFELPLLFENQRLIVLLTLSFLGLIGSLYLLYNQKLGVGILVFCSLLCISFSPWLYGSTQILDNEGVFILCCPNVLSLLSLALKKNGISAWRLLEGDLKDFLKPQKSWFIYTVIICLLMLYTSAGKIERYQEECAELHSVHNMDSLKLDSLQEEK